MKHFRQILYGLLLVWWTPAPCPAQDQHLIDSLSGLLKGPDSETKLQALSDLAWEYNNIDPDKAIAFSRQALKLAQKLGSQPGIANVYQDLGTSFFYRRDFDTSEHYYRLSEKLTAQLKDTLSLASLYNKMGTLYKEKSEYGRSLQYLFASLKIYQQLHNDHKIALLLNNIGVTYEVMRHYAKALVYYEQSLGYHRKEQNETGMARNYLGMGNVSTAMRKLDQALRYYGMAETIFRKAQWLRELSVTLNNIGNVLDEQGLYEASVAKRTEALQIMTEGEDFFEATKYRAYIAGTLMKAGRFTEAKQHIDEAQKLAAGISSGELDMEINEALARYYFGTGQYLKGNAFLVRFHDLKDSIYNAGLSGSIARLEVEHNTNRLRIEKAETLADNLRLQQEKTAARTQRNYVLIASAGLLVIAALFLFLYFQKRRQREEKTRIMAMLASEEKERTRIARELHDGLGQLLSAVKLNASSVSENLQGEDREILEHSLKLVDEAIGEVRSVSHNLMPLVLEQKGLLPAIENLVNGINRSKKLEMVLHTSGKPPQPGLPAAASVYRIVQEVINNMLKHAGASRITLNMDFSRDTCSMNISDNGKGFNTGHIDESQGLGWNNIFTRVQLLSGHCQVSSAPGKGTSVNIRINL